MPDALDTLDTLVTGAHVVSPTGVAPAAIAMRDGRVEALLEPSARPAARVTIDASGLHALPGIIDTHVHTRHPGVPAREDFESGTAAAAAGGVTTLLEMPIARTPVNDAESLGERARLLAETAHVDFALYGGAGQQNLDAIAEQAAGGAVAFKTFLVPPPAGREQEFDGLWCTDHAALRDVMAAVAATGLPHAFHCEDAAMVAGLQRRLRDAGRIDGLAHAESRPAVVEDVSVSTVLAIGADTGDRVHVVHVSSPRAAALVRDARRRGQRATAETCPHYLFLTHDALRTHGPFAKCNPALRSGPEVEALWAAVLDATIDVVGSDHSPFLVDEKRAGDEDIFAAPPGFPGLETLLPLMLTAVADERLELPALARLMAERAAALFDLPGKGRLAPGFDADLTLVDLGASWTFESARCRSRARDTMRVYEGWPMRGRVVSTFVRGARVFHEGQLLQPPGHGRIVRPPIRTDATAEPAGHRA